MRIRVINAAGWILFLVSAVVKVFIGAGYRSTDFEVHRNWLALTHSLPVSRWYYEATSQWTLDYPPLFAYFEWLLSQAAQFFDPEMLKVQNLGYDSLATVVFQRGSVIAADLVLMLGILRFIATLSPIPARNPDISETEEQMRLERSSLLESKAIVLLIATVFNAGLLMVDHIHFQYNGMLLGILLLSLAAVNGDRPLEAAFWFALLLQFKHIFLYVAPIYGIYLLRSYCLDESRWWDVRRLKWTHLFSLAFVVLSIFAVSLGPFIIMGQLPQLLSRLFPFKRGLVHAYWAPNFWSLYLFADLVLARVLGLQGSGATGGLVGASSTIVLPEVPPIVTVLLTALAMTPCLWKLWQKPTKEVFLFAFVPISLCSFMFGWHVHEKAILITIIPFTAICLERLEWSQAFLRLTLLGHFSLLPLIFEPGESALRYFLLLAHWLICTLFINKFYRRLYRHDPHPVLNKRDAQIMAGLASVAILNEWILPSLAPHLIFLPLLLTSVYCAAGLSYVFYAVTSYTMQL